MIDSKNGTNNRVAAGFALFAVLLFSLQPLAYSFGDSSNAPFLFVALVHFFSFIACIIYFIVFEKSKINNSTLRLVAFNLRNRAILWATLGRLGSVLFAFSLKYIDVAVATVFVETWPLFMVLLTAWLFKAEKRYRKITIETFCLLLYGFIGFAFAIFSQTENIDNVISTLFKNSTILGIALAMLTSFCGGLVLSYTLRWGADVSQQATKNNDNQFFFTIVSYAIALILSSFIALILGLSLGEKIGNNNIMVAASYGFLGGGIGSIILRIANIKTDNLGINAMVYAAPVFALIWLGFASLIDVLHLDLLIIGAIAIIAANLLINFEASISLAYKALIIALWACGTMVYLHDGFVLHDYASTVALSATVFILILSFRIDRLVRRATEEENMTFSLFHKLSSFAGSGTMSKDHADDAKQALLEIDAPQTPEQLRRSYQRLQDCLQIGKVADDILNKMRAEIDILTHSKQQGNNFGELTAMAFIGIILIFSLLFFRPPEITGWEGVFVEVSAFMLAAVVLFLFFNILDLHNHRHKPIIEKNDRDKGGVGFSIIFRDATNRSFEQWISVIVCLSISLAYSYLFWQKWFAIA